MTYEFLLIRGRWAWLFADFFHQILSKRPPPHQPLLKILKIRKNEIIHRLLIISGRRARIFTYFLGLFTKCSPPPTPEKCKNTGKWLKWRVVYRLLLIWHLWGPTWTYFFDQTHHIIKNLKNKGTEKGCLDILPPPPLSHVTALKFFEKITCIACSPSFPFKTPFHLCGCGPTPRPLEVWG